MENFMGGMIVGAVLFAALLALGPSVCKEAKEALVTCEQSLPRDQQCKLIGVPK